MAATSPRWCGLWLSVAVCLSASSVAAVPRVPHQGTARVAQGDASAYRLPGEAKPIHYDIHLVPTVGPNDFLFEGKVDILLQATKDSDTLTLHADQLSGLKCTLDRNTELGDPDEDKVHQFVTFNLKKASASLEKDKKYVLSCDYNGIISDDDKGFYRSSYYDQADDELKWMGITQFEMTFARRALPCFDEPGYRATFQLSISHTKDVNVVSNTRISTVTKPSAAHLVTTTFEKTPSMAVYTLAWMVSQMPSETNADLNFTTYAQPAEMARTALSQSVGPQVLRGMEDYTGIAYKLDKMDQVAVPDHNFGAMENWGLVTYRQALLLAGDKSRAETTLSVTTTIAHELVHQWFGNLVTPSWWSHVWLSEAFAEFFCYVMTDKINPDWSVMDKMPLLEMHDAFLEDSLASSTPMNHDVDTPDEILDNFGSITYAKGSSVLRMLRDAINDVEGGPDKFQQGLRDYLNTMQGTGVVQPDNLLDALNNVADKVDFPGSAFKDMAKTWTDQAGYPLITVTREGEKATLQQARFYSSDPPASDTTLWTVPMKWKVEGTDMTLRNTLTEKSQDLRVVHASSKWILINANQLGYFRVQYDDANWAALSEALVKKVDALTVAERAMLVDDSLVLARAGVLAYDVALRLNEYLAQEKAYAPWAAFQSNIEYVAMQLRAGTGKDLFNKWVQRLVRTSFEAFSMTPATTDTFEDHLGRGVVAAVAYEADDPNAVNEADLKYMDWSSSRGVDPDSLRVILCQGLKQQTTSAVFVDLLTRLAASEDEAARKDLTYALGCAPETDQLQLKTQLLQTLISDTGLQARDVKALWKSLIATEEGLTFTLGYLIDHASELSANPNVGPVKLGEMFKTVAPRVASQANYEKLEAYSKTVPAGSVDLATAVADALAVAKINLDWRATYHDKIVDYLSAPEPQPVTTSAPTGAPTSAPVTGPTAATSEPPTAAPTLPPSSYDLPETVSPSDYVIILTVDQAASSISGMIAIDVMAVDEDVSTITMHAAGLSFTRDSVKLATYGDEEVAVTDVNFNADVEQVDLVLADVMAPGMMYTLTINYTGSVRNDYTGLHHANFGNGKMIASQLFPAYARRVLPCWDEPRYRATIDLTVVHDKTLTAISNTPSLGSAEVPDSDTLILDTFTPTDEIPVSQLGVYLVDAAQLSASDSSSKGVVMYGSKEFVTKASDTLDTADTLFKWFVALTNSDPALDQISLLGLTDSAREGSHAWGLIGMREHDLADLDLSSSSGESEQTWLLQLARQMSQIWFGDLVGISWWNDAWLREGLSTFYEYVAANNVESRWELLGQLYTRAVSPALHADSIESTHSLNSDVSGQPQAILDSLDVIVSGKGAGVVQMLSHALERNGSFVAGIKEYLRGYGFGYATADNLLSAMQTGVKEVNGVTELPDGVTIGKVFSSWVNIDGYPVVTAIRDYNKKTATLTQERFLLHTPSSSSLNMTGRWWVPLSYALQSEYMSSDESTTAVKTWLQPGLTQSVDVQLNDNSEWLLVNTDRRDFFRVNYDVHNWMLLRNYLDEYHQLLDTGVRAGLVDDALALARSGRLDNSVALQFVDYLRVDYDLAPWEAARAAFDYLDAQLLESRHEKVYKTWLLQLLDEAFQQSNWFPEERDQHVQRLTRAVATAWACETGHKSCLKYAAADFSQWLDNSDSVGHDTLAATACVGLSDPDVDVNDLQTVLTKLRLQPEDRLRASIILGLGCVSSKNAKVVLGLTAKSGLRQGEAALVFKSVSRRGPTSVTDAIAYLAANLNPISAASGRASVLSIFEILASRVTTQSQYDKLSSLASKIDASRLQGALRLAEDNIEWRTANLDDVADVLYSLTKTPDPDLPTTTSAPTTVPTIPTGITYTDPPTAGTRTTSGFWTLPPSASTAPDTLPTLGPRPTPGPVTPGPVDPETRTPQTTSGWFTLPPTRPTAPVTLPPFPPTDSSRTTAGSSGTWFTLPPTRQTEPVTLPPLTTAAAPTDAPTSTPKPSAAPGLGSSIALLVASVLAVSLHAVHTRL